MVSNISDDILIEIFSHLPPWTLHTVATINTVCSSMAKKLGARRLDFADFHEKQFTENNATKIIEHIKKLIPTQAGQATSTRHILVISKRLLPNKVFAFLQRRCTNVVSFDYDYTFLKTKITAESQSDHHLHPFYSFGWRHSVAHLPACHFEQQRWWSDMKMCKRLESVYIRAGDYLLKHGAGDNGDDSLTLPRLPRLKVLTLHVPSLTLDEHIIDKVIHKRCPRLTTLVLRGTRLGGYSNFHRVSPGVHCNIEELKLEYVTFTNFALFGDLPRRYPNLQSLTLSLTNYEHQHYHGNKEPSTINPFYICGANERVYDLIVGFKQLTNLVVHLDEFGTPENPMDYWFERKMQDYFSTPGTKLMNCKISYGPIPQKPEKIGPVYKMFSKFFDHERKKTNK